MLPEVQVGVREFSTMGLCVGLRLTASTREGRLLCVYKEKTVSPDVTTRHGDDAEEIVSVGILGAPDTSYDQDRNYDHFLAAAVVGVVSSGISPALFLPSRAKAE